MRYRPLAYRRPRVRFSRGCKVLPQVASAVMSATDVIRITFNPPITNATSVGFAVQVNGGAAGIGGGGQVGDFVYELVLTAPTGATAVILLAYGGVEFLLGGEPLLAFLRTVPPFVGP